MRSPTTNAAVNTSFLHFCDHSHDSNAGVPQGNALGLALYLLYTSDLPQPEEATVATSADDTAIMAVGDSAEVVTEKLQRAIDKVNI